MNRYLSRELSTARTRASENQRIKDFVNRKQRQKKKKETERARLGKRL